MQGLKIYTKSGESPTSEEIEFAHRVANQHKEMKFGVITMTDPTSGVIVDYHAYNKTAFTSGDFGAYFGYNASVDMRCWCRGVVLAETAAQTGILRSAVFLTDGTELVSVPIEGPIYINENTYILRSFLSLLSRIPGFNSEYGWRSAGNLAVFEYYVTVPSTYEVKNIGYVGITLPEDLCYVKDNTDFPVYFKGDANLTHSFVVGRIVSEHVPIHPYTTEFGNYNGFKYTIYGTLLESFADAATACMSHIDNVMVQNLGENEAREHARRKKCSDGQLTYLRNGFLSPEFERFIKANHPISALLRRDIPMQIISAPAHTIINEERDSEGVLIARTYESRLTLRYETINDDGSIAAHEKEFIGQVRFTKYTATYTNYPLLGNLLNGGATPVYTNFTGDEDVKQAILQYWIYYRTGSQIVHDITSAISSLFCEVNGTLTDNRHFVPTDEFIGSGLFTAEYIPSETVQSSYGDLRISHPQFLLDYIAASKPIEKEIIDGNKVPVTPSTDWLSSRLAHNEVVTIVPLSFVNADGIDRGMYPYSRTDEVPAQVNLVGFAKVKYDYFTGSFTFESWTEFTTEGNIKHDGNASYDAETNPTSVNIGGTVYTLQPKYFAYNSAWDTPNCVCIAGKTPWTDTKEAYKTQKSHISDIPPEGYTLTAEEILYNEVRKAIK